MQKMQELECVLQDKDRPVVAIAVPDGPEEIRQNTKEEGPSGNNRQAGGMWGLEPHG